MGRNLRPLFLLQAFIAAILKKSLYCDDHYCFGRNFQR